MMPTGGQGRLAGLLEVEDLGLRVSGLGLGLLNFDPRALRDTLSPPHSDRKVTSHVLLSWVAV